MPTSLRDRGNVDYRKPVAGTGTPAWLKAENKIVLKHEEPGSPELRPQALMHKTGRPSAQAGNGAAKAAAAASKAKGVAQKSKKAASGAPAPPAPAKERKAGRGSASAAGAPGSAAATGAATGTAPAKAIAAIAAHGDRKTAKTKKAAGFGLTKPKAKKAAPTKLKGKAAAAARKAQRQLKVAGGGDAAAAAAARRRQPERPVAADPPAAAEAVPKEQPAGKPRGCAKAAGKAKADSARTSHKRKEPETDRAASAGPSAATAATAPAPAKRARKGTADSGAGAGAGTAGAAAAGPSENDEAAVPAEALMAQHGRDYAELMRQYRRLLQAYGSLKSQKIGQLEGLMAEQDKVLLAAAEDAKRSEERWKREARARRQAAESVNAQDARRRMKALQDELIGAKSAVHEAEKALRLREIELLERDTRVVELEGRVRAAREAAQRPKATVGVDPKSPPAPTPGAAAAAAAAAASPGVGLQCPTPHAGAAAGPPAGAAPLSTPLARASGAAAADGAIELSAGRQSTARPRSGGAAATAARPGGGSSPVQGLVSGGGCADVTQLRGQQPSPRLEQLLQLRRRMAGGGAGAVAATPLSQLRAGVRAPANTPATAGARSPLASHLARSQGAASSAGRSPSAALVPIRYLFGLEVRDPPAGERGILYTHRATGFTFQLGPAPAPAHERSAASGGEGSAWDGGDDDDDEVEEDEEEQVAFVPVELGDAAKCLPEFLKEPITFAASRKEQLVKIIFDSLAGAKHARAQPTAAAGAKGRGSGGRWDTAKENAADGDAVTVV